MNAHIVSLNRPEGNTANFGDLLGGKLAAERQAPDDTPLTADEQQIRRFVNVLFKRCVLPGGLPFGGRFTFRAFQHSDDTPVLHDEWEPLAGKPIARAAQLATKIARRPAVKAAVFAPPVCLFDETGRAGAANVFACPVIMVDLDASPLIGRRSLEELLGPATLVVASGGRWTGPDGNTEDKLHLYWRLSSPAVDESEKALLRGVRAKAAKLVDADTTAVPLSHPLRWPGSWHTKAEPRLCRIIDGNDAAEIDLADAAARLGVDIDAARQRRHGVRPDGKAFTTRREWTAVQLMDAAQHLPNPDLDWDQWNTIGMALYDAAHGSDAGLDAFDLFSRKSGRYNEEATVSRYDHYSTSPPDQISGSWLERRIRDTVDPLYCLPPRELSDDERAEVHALFSAAAASQAQRNAREDPPQEPSIAPQGLRVVTGLVDPTALPVRQWLIAPRLPVGDVCQCVGEPGISKSTFTLRDALAIATGREEILRGLSQARKSLSWERLHKSGPVLIYNAEDRLAEMERRLAAAQQYLAISSADMRHPIILWSGVDHDHLVIMRRAEQRGALRPAPGLDALEATIRLHQVAFIALDPQASLVSGGAENDTDDQDALFQQLARLAFRTNCSIMVVHHTSKATRDAAGDMGAGRGAFSAVAKVRSAFTLTNVTGNRPDEQGWALSGSNAGLIRLDYSKLSHERKPATPLVFRRVSAPVGNGSGVRAEAGAALFDQDPRAALEMAGDNAPVLELVDIASLTAKGGESSPPLHAEAVAQVVSDIIGDRAECSWGSIWEIVAERLRSAGVTTARGRPSIHGLVMAALMGEGVELSELGQTVRICAAQRGTSEKAPWILSKIAVATKGE